MQGSANRRCKSSLMASIMLRFTEVILIGSYSAEEKMQKMEKVHKQKVSEGKGASTD